AARLHSFTHLLSGPEQTKEMETSLAAWIESENRETYVRGDLFGGSDHVFFLIFDHNKGSVPLIRAGIVYETGTPEPFRKLDSFCLEIRDFLVQTEGTETGTEKREKLLRWA